MARKKDDNVLALTPLASNSSAATNTGLVPRNSFRALTRDEERLIEEDRKQQLAIEIRAAKGRLGMSKIAEVHKHAELTFDEAAGFIVEIKDRPGRSPQLQAYVEQFSERQIQLLAQHLLGVVDVSATGIGMEVHRDPYPPPERRAGFLERLFGG